MVRWYISMVEHMPANGKTRKSWSFHDVQKLRLAFFAHLFWLSGLQDRSRTICEISQRFPRPLPTSMCNGGAELPTSLESRICIRPKAPNNLGCDLSDSP